MKIRKNLGTVDRVGRIVVGVVLLLSVLLAFVGPASTWAYLGLLGLFPLVAGIVGYSPPYALLGLDTSRARPARGDLEQDQPLERACC